MLQIHAIDEARSRLSMKRRSPSARTARGTADGSVDGSADGTADGTAEGTVESADIDVGGGFGCCDASSLSNVIKLIRSFWRRPSKV